MMKLWRIAIVLLAAEIFVVVAAIHAEAQQPTQSLGVGVSIPPPLQTETKSSAAKPPSDQRGTTPIVVQALPAPLSDKEAAEIKYREKQATTERWLVGITGVLAVAALLQWGALGYLSWLLRKSIQTQTTDMGRYITEAARAAGAMERAADAMAQSVASAAESIAAAKAIAESQNLVPELAAMISEAARHSDAD